MGFSFHIALSVVLLSSSYHAAKIKYILRSGSLDTVPELLDSQWPRESHSIAGSASNSIQQTTEANYQDCDLIGSCGGIQADNYGLDATFKPYPQDHLEKILKKFSKGDTKLANVYIDRSDVAEPIHNDPKSEEQPQLQNDQQTQDKSKSWNLVNGQGHRHPYDDRQGWVTLEPIAWSASQIQKWEPNPRPTFPPPNEVGDYWNNGPSPSSGRPPYSSSERPTWNKPTYDYNQKPQWGNKWPSSSNQNYEYKPSYSGGSNWGGGNPDIITDDRPSSFPPDSRPAASDSQGGYRPWGSSNYNQQGPSNYNYPSPSPSPYKPTYTYGSSSERPSNNNYQSSADGDGHWVLLSSTKGYSIPQRHRSNSRSMNLSDVSKSELPKTITANAVTR